MAALPAIQPEDTLGSIKNILELVKGKTSTQSSSGGSATSTTSSNVSAEGITAMLNQILGSSQGLASVASGQHSAGLYNSTVNQQLINDLSTRAAGEVAQKTAGTTTTQVTSPSVVTTKQAPVIGKQDISQGAKILGALQAFSSAKNVLGPIVQKTGAKFGINSVDDLHKKLSDILGFDSGADISSAAASATGGMTTSIGNSINLGVNSTSPNIAPDAGAGLTSDLTSMLMHPQAVSSPDSLTSYAQSLDQTLSSSGSDALINPDLFTTSQSVSDTPSLSNSLSLGVNSDSPGFKLSDGGDELNFSNASAGDKTSAGAGSDMAYGSTVLSAARYLSDPKAVKNVFDFNNKPIKDDVGDITDAAAAFDPEPVTKAGLSLVHPALNLGDASMKSAHELVTDPGEFVSGIGHGDNDFINASIALAQGAVSSVVNSADMVVRGTETAGNAIGDVAQPVGDAVGGAVQAVGDAIGGAVSSVNDAINDLSIICTELRRQGKLSNVQYIYGMKDFSRYSDFHKAGYYVWAAPTVRFLRANPNHAFSKFIGYIFLQRASYIAAKYGYKRAKKSISGFLITQAIYLFCVGLSYFLQSNYSFKGNQHAEH